MGSEGRSQLCEGDGPNTSHTFFSFSSERGDKRVKQESRSEGRRESRAPCFNVKDEGRACNITEPQLCTFTGYE